MLQGRAVAASEVFEGARLPLYGWNAEPLT